MAVKEPATRVWEDVWIPTVCDMCYNGCTIRVRRVNGVAVKIEGIPDAPPNYGKVCAKGNAGLMNLYNPGRILHPLVRTNPEKGIGVDPKWKQVTWDEALNLFVSRLQAARAKDPRSVIGASFDSYSHFMLRSFLTAFGSPNLTTASAGFFCGNGMHPVAYTFTGSNDVHPDLEHCNYLLMFGTSYGFVAQANAMGLTQEMARARMRGMKLAVVDPVCTYAASKADEWIPIRPGTDAAFALSLMNVLANELHRVDEGFLRQYTNSAYLIGPDGHYVRDRESGKPMVWDARAGEARTFDAVAPEDAALEVGAQGLGPLQGLEARPGFQLFKDHLRTYSPERAAEITSVPAETIRRVARDLAEAASIGSTIRLEGHELPLRPAAVIWYRGISAHKHAMLNGMSVGQINLLLGALDVPGGLLNATASGPFWGPREDADGLLIPGNPFTFRHMRTPLPRRAVKQPETLELIELFPLSVYARAMLWLGVLHAEQFGLPYRAEVLIQCRTNVMAAGADPEVTAEALKRIPFIVSLADHHDETTEFADLLLPDAHNYERLVPVAFNPYYRYNNAALPGEAWLFSLQQPVVSPAGEARYWIEVLLEVADRLGILPDLNTTFNTIAQLEDPYRLDPNRKYTWAEICDQWTRSYFGAEHGLEYFREHGYYKAGRRNARQSYPRAFHSARIPLYLEHFLGAGEEVRQFTEEHDLPWDTSDYVALTEWKACPAHSESPPEYDLWVVNQKLPFLTYTFTGENPWLMDLAERNTRVFPVGINAETARRKGINEEDEITLETPSGRQVRGLAHLSQGVHPECLAVPGILGRWVTSLDKYRGKGIHFNQLVEYSMDRLDTLAAAVDACVKVKVSKAPKR
ncbi:MAG: molybdopterin-dependent oxidoreductase [Chloroflexi bacterium]|nr:molybdopterin-dependent oxidoreductase [Chloroflexota bacterium]